MTDGNTIANTARLAVGANWATDIAGWCSRFVREVLQRAGVAGDLWGGTAIETAGKFRAAGQSLTPAQAGTLQPGDVLFQEFGSPDKNGKPQGHTAIYLGNGQIAENTWTDGIGKRIGTLAGFGQVTSVGRVGGMHPDPYGAYAAGTLPTPFTGGAPRPYALSSGAASVDSRAAGVSFTDQARRRWQDFTGGFSVGGQVQDAVGGWFSQLWAAIAPYLASAGLLAVALLLLLLGAWAAIQGGK